jgi:prepilin-type N-terminal cleavage/methylation domain-containing protein
MSPIQRLRARLRDQRGFTLVELLVATSVGIVIVLAMFNLVDSSTRASANVEDRVDAVQRGRAAIEQITQRLRSQVCLGEGIAAITEAKDDSITFYAQLSGDTFSPERRQISFTGGSITESVWYGTGTPPNMTYPEAPTYTRSMVRDIARATDPASGAEIPVFRYFAFVGNDPAKPSLKLQTPLVPADMARTVKIEVTFDARPGRRAGQGNRIDTTFGNEVFVRTADPTEPTKSPLCL